MSSSKVPDLSVSKFVSWMDKLYTGFAEAYEENGNNIHDSLSYLYNHVPDGIGDNTALMLERIPLRASIWDLKPKSLLAVRLGDMLSEIWDSDDYNDYTRIVSLICSDSSLVGKDSLFLVVATAVAPEDTVEYDFSHLLESWYSNHTATPRIISGYTTFTAPDGYKYRMAVIAIQLSSYK